MFLYPVATTDIRKLYICRSIINSCMIDQIVIDKINKGDEKAFECLYNDYFVYLCACADSYIFNQEEAQDIVNEVFIKLWRRRGNLLFPIHAYLIRSVQHECLNYLRSLHNREKVIDEYREMLLEYQEEYCISECEPLKEMERADLERSVKVVITSLPNKCKTTFEQYLYSEMTPREIAEKNGISVNTVRVHIKTAMDKMKEMLGRRFGILLCFLF